MAVEKEARPKKRAQFREGVRSNVQFNADGSIVLVRLAAPTRPLNR